MKLHPKYKWWWEQYYKPRFKTDVGVDYSKHIFSVGSTGTGKTYLNLAIAEYEVFNGYSKFIYLSGWNKKSVNEALGLNFGNSTQSPRDYREFAFTKRYPEEWQEKIASGEIKVKVYVPLMGTLPDKLPDNYIPFTCPLKDLANSEIGEPAFRTLFTGREHKAYYSKFKKTIDRLSKNDSFPEFWTEIQMQKKAPPSGFEKVDGLDWFVGDFPTENPQELAVILNKLSAFTQDKFISNSKHPNNLHDLMRDELKDQKTIVILDLEYIEDPTLKLFMMIYFQSTINWIMGSEGYYQKLKHGLLVFYDDAYDYLKSTRMKTTQDADLPFAAFFETMITKIRKYHVTLMLSIQTPSYLEGVMKTNFGLIFIFNLEEDNDVEWAGKIFNESPQTIRQIMAQFRLRKIQGGERRFLVANERYITRWQHNKTTEYGCRLLRPRLSEPREIDFGTTVEDLAEELGVGITDLPKKLKEQQFEDYKHRLIKLKEKVKKFMPKKEEENLWAIASRLNQTVALLRQKASKRIIMSSLKCSLDTANKCIETALLSPELSEEVKQYYRKRFGEGEPELQEVTEEIPA